MSLPRALTGRLRIPAIASPMFLVSGPDLVVETCRSGVLGTFPTLNQRSAAGYGDWLDEIAGRLAEHPDAAPYGVNIGVHRSNSRLDADFAVTVARKVPLVITSLGAVPDLVKEIHGYGGLVFHDVINLRHAEKAIAAGVDGIVAVAGGAGGHAGATNPFALVSEIRTIFDGAIALAGAISNGAQIAAAQMMGADLAYLGTRFIATRESLAVPEYKAMLLRNRAADIVYTPAISGVNASFLRESIVANGLDPDHLPEHARLDLANEVRVWKTVWSAGHGVGAIADIPTAAELCDRLAQEYAAARRSLAA